MLNRRNCRLADGWEALTIDLSKKLERQVEVLRSRPGYSGAMLWQLRLKLCDGLLGRNRDLDSDKDTHAR